VTFLFLYFFSLWPT